ncbi:MAG: B12-binding domain-containing radical SAM protein, partial [Acetivibrio ethanolgignens]
LCYDNQIFFFLEAANYIRAKFKKKIVIGGPVVSSIIRKSSFNIQYDFFEHYSKYIDYLVIGDGEYPLFDLFNKRHNVNVLSYPFKVENHEDCSMQNKVPPLLTPKFSKLPLNLYFTPQLVLPLISARHCYWGRCKFCTHSVGYNEYVKYGVEDIKKCLISLGNDLGAKNFYFVDECMAPSTAKSLANWIEKNNLNISWMTDMRFEKTLANENFIKKLAKGGLKYIAFGMESANERVLKKMEKGTTREVMQNVINNCHKNNINTTLMFFFGFPTETKAEAEDTINFIINNSSKINGIGMGCFTLVPGSFVYNNPKEFGIYAIDENGYYKNTEGMSYEEIRQFFTIWNEYIKKNYYRGHPFYHRIFYLLDLDEKDKWMYPIGLTNFSNIKSLTKKEIKNVDYYLKKTVIAKKICSNDNKSGFDLIYMMDVENIVEVIICIDLKLYDSINSHSLNDGQIRKLYSLGVIE